jgi:selenium metabolism protein YedF
MKTIDCRNMACPLPVVTVKRALEESEVGELLVLLDDGAPRENVTRFVRNRGYEVSETVSDDGVTIVIRGATDVTEGGAVSFPVPSGKPVLLVTSDRLGDGPEELGRLLMKNFIITLLESAELPDKMLFVNRGVLLATEGSELLEALDKLGKRGVEIFSCGVCLDFFGKREQLGVGLVTNMFSIVETLMSGSGMIRL